MDIANGLKFRLKQILSKLKLLNIVRSYTLKIEFGKIGEDLKDCLIEVNSLLTQCEEKIRSKPRRAEIRNIIGELVRKKNTKRVKDEQINTELTTLRETEVKKYQKFGLGKKFVCEICDVKFIHYSNLKTHILKFHESALTFKSTESFKILTTAGESEYHLATENLFNKESPSFKNCQDSSDDIIPEDLNRKLSRLTKDEENGIESNKVNIYICPLSECQLSFQNERSLKKHIRLKHNTNLEYHCSKCDKIFSAKTNLNRHFLTHQLGQFQCSKCSRTFHRKDNLKRHISLHHESVNAFECSFCKKKFSLKYNRDTHESSVHTNKEIHCEICGKKCKNKITMKIHKRLHEENRISCSLCCKTFSRKIYYRNHLKRKHKGLSPYQKLFDSFATVGANCSS